MVVLGKSSGYPMGRLFRCVTPTVEAGSNEAIVGGRAVSRTRDTVQPGVGGTGVPWCPPGEPLAVH